MGDEQIGGPAGLLDILEELITWPEQRHPEPIPARANMIRFSSASARAYPGYPLARWTPRRILAGLLAGWLSRPAGPTVSIALLYIAVSRVFAVQTSRDGKFPLLQ